MRKVLVLSSVVVSLTLLLAGRAAAQSGTVTDDAFVSTNPTTELLNLKGQGISLIVAGSSATVGSVSVGTSKSCIKFQLQFSLPPNAAAANVQKATPKLFLSPLTAPAGSIDIYPVTSTWSESTLSASATPTIAANPFATASSLGNANSFLVVDVTQLVQGILAMLSRGGAAGANSQDCGIFSGGGAGGSGGNLGLPFGQISHAGLDGAAGSAAGVAGLGGGGYTLSSFPGPAASIGGGSGGSNNGAGSAGQPGYALLIW